MRRSIKNDKCLSQWKTFSAQHSGELTEWIFKKREKKRSKGEDVLGVQFSFVKVSQTSQGCKRSVRQNELFQCL